EELMAINVRDTYVNPNDRRRFQRTINSKGFVRDHELKLRRKDGTLLDCLLSSTQLRSDDGTLLGYHGIIRDVTEKKRAEQEIRRLDQTRREFVANASHEFKTPLTAIRGFAETLLSGTLEKPEDYRYFLRIIHDNALRLERLTEDLAKISLMDEGRLAQRFSDVSVCDFIRSCAETSRLKAEQNGITLQVNCSRHLPLVRGDLSRLREVLQNLLDNAIHYTPAGGHIRVQAACVQDRWVVVSVSDTGIGIPKDKQTRIFERFYRVDSSRSRKVGGTGLGLAIVKKIVEAHGGHIEVESEPGQGSTFSVFLPQVAEPAAQALERSRRRGRSLKAEAPERVLSEEEPGSYYSDQSRS
ncbi:MAG TPA: PAS domain-containing sensor histidine kinase, partial [Firmicutes bacterium]|nr:PAS domain-containing sensor histidine kinase [Bacillota bacterium]